MIRLRSDGRLTRSAHGALGRPHVHPSARSRSVELSNRCTPYRTTSSHVGQTSRRHANGRRGTGCKKGTAVILTVGRWRSQKRLDPRCVMWPPLIPVRRISLHCLRISAGLLLQLHLTLRHRQCRNALRHADKEVPEVADAWSGGIHVLPSNCTPFMHIETAVSIRTWREPPSRKDLLLIPRVGRPHLQSKLRCPHISGKRYTSAVLRLQSSCWSQPTACSQSLIQALRRHSSRAVRCSAAHHLCLLIPAHGFVYLV